MSFNTFDQVVGYMEHFTNLERKTDSYSRRTYRLDRMGALMGHLGNPQRSYRTIHVAGSKGKGSTASYIACGLRAAGFKTGLYMSPHVSNYRERFTLCGNFVDDPTLIRVGNALASALEDFHFSDELGENEPTTFELYTAFAFLLFKEIGCDWAVIETGLGGRLDATNIIIPEASVLTSIELEHTDILGDTISLIATEKSKIIKPGVPAFVGIQPSCEALPVFQAEADACHSELYPLSLCATALTPHGVKFSDGFKVDFHLSMAGLVQAQNCALAILVLRTLGLYGPGTLEALNANQLPGRMELIKWVRPLYLDGAHTQNSMGALLDTFRQMYPGRSGMCIYGSVSGKNVEAMSTEVLSAFDSIVVCRPGTFKKSDPKALYELLCSKKSENQTVVLLEDAREALSYCAVHCPVDEPVLCCGSFYLAGEIKGALCL